MGSMIEIFNFLGNSIRIVGAGIVVFGVIELIQALNENNPQAKTVGIKLLASGLVMIYGAEPLINWFQSFLPR